MTTEPQQELFPQQAPASLLPRKIYIIVVEDGHADVDVIPYYGREEAIAQARKLVNDYCRYPEDIEESLTVRMAQQGWIYYCVYSGDGDSVRVIEETIR